MTPAGAIVDRYAGVVFDVDGVLLRLHQPVDGAAESLAALRERGTAVAFVTNNASRTPAQVADTLTAAGLPADPAQVITSSTAAAQLLEPGTRCLVIGMDGLRTALADRGCPTVTEPEEADAVVVGWQVDLTWDDLRRATLAIARGARFVGTNADRTYPAPEGPWPGNGATLAALTAASGRQPEIAGKPSPALFRAAAEHLPPGPLLMVGDRPETDLDGAAALGWDTALVLTGVTPAAEADAVRPRPSWVLQDLRGLLDDAPPAPRGDVSIRPARATDGQAILGLWDQAGMLAYTHEPERDITAVLAADADAFLIAEVAGEPVGVIMGSNDGRRGWINRLAIAPRHRATGIGRALVAEAERVMRARGLPQANLLVFADNRDAQAFWERLGYSASAPVTLRTKRLGTAAVDAC
jgi:HAD superfamily hydrolase (TIGR01450 family)